MCRLWWGWGDLEREVLPEYAPERVAGMTGLRVVITRSEHQADALAAAFAAAGFRVEPLPLLEIVPPADPRPLERAATELALYDWLVFTSANAVEAFLPLTGGTLAAPGDLLVDGWLANGVTPPADLQPGDGLFFTLSVTAATALSQNAYQTGSGVKFIATGPATALNMDSGNFTFFSAPSGTAGAAPSWTSIGTLSANGTLTLINILNADSRPAGPEEPAFTGSSGINL